MKAPKKIKQLFKDSNVTVSSDFNDKVLFDAGNKLTRTEATPSVSIWRTIMKSPITKIAAAAAIIIIAAIAVITFVNQSIPTAYALEQTIQANHSVRYLHIKNYIEDSNEPREFWVQCDETGRVKNARSYFPASEDGPKVVVWSEGIAQVWFKRKNSFLTVRDEKVSAEMLKLVRECDPRLAVERLYEQEKQYKIKLNINEPSDKAKDITITVDSTPSDRKEIFFVDQATKLLTAIEFYQLKDGDYQHYSTMEFYDYNQPIEPEMFSLDKEIPTNVMRIDQTKEFGLIQGNMTDEEAAVEVARQFFEALIFKDYAKAGNLFENIPADRMEQMFGRIKFLRIVSIGPAIPQPDWDEHGFKVPCELEITTPDGQKTTWKPGVYVRPGDDEMHPDRWNITGGVHPPTVSESYVRLSNTNSAKRFVITGWCDSKMQHCEEMKWTNEPEILPDNDVYSKMSPADVVRAFNDAISRQDFNEMRKFVPDSFVEPLKREFEETVKRGVEISPPVLEVIGEAFWSAEHSVYFVKCRSREE